MTQSNGRNPFAQLAALRDSLPAGTQRSNDPAPEAPSASDVLRGKIVVRREKKGRGGHTVTRVDGLQGTEPERQAIAKQLRTAMGCSTSFEQDQSSLIVHGDLVDRVAAWLTNAGAQRVVKGA